MLTEIVYGHWMKLCWMKNTDLWKWEQLQHWATSAEMSTAYCHTTAKIWQSWRSHTDFLETVFSQRRLHSLSENI